MVKKSEDKAAQLGKAVMTPSQFVLAMGKDKALVVDIPKSDVMANLTDGFCETFKENSPAFLAALLSSEKERIKTVLYFQENKTVAATILGMSVRKLHRKINQYKIDR